VLAICAVGGVVEICSCEHISPTTCPHQRLTRCSGSGSVGEVNVSSESSMQIPIACVHSHGSTWVCWSMESWSMCQVLQQDEALHIDPLMRSHGGPKRIRMQGQPPFKSCSPITAIQLLEQTPRHAFHSFSALRTVPQNMAPIQGEVISWSSGAGQIRTKEGKELSFKQDDIARTRCWMHSLTSSHSANQWQSLAHTHPKSATRSSATRRQVVRTGSPT
jgi:hypothetical protein